MRKRTRMALPIALAAAVMLMAWPVHAGTVAYYSFDAGNADDLSVNANHGVVGGSITYQGDTPPGLGGQSARSYTGGGGGNVVTVPTSPSLAAINHSLSLSYWMKSNLDDNANWVRVFQHANEGGGTQGWMVNRYSGNNEVNVRVDTLNPGGQHNQNIARGGPALFDNTWHHVAFTLDSGTWTKFEDGSPVGTGAYNHGQGLANTRDLYLFGRNTVGEYVGFLDEVAVYDAKLAPNQVQHLYTGGDPLNLPAAAPPPTATVGTFTGGDPGDGLDLEGNFLYAVNVGTAGVQTKSSGPYNVGDVVFANDAANSGVSNTQTSVINNWANPDLGASSDDGNLEFAMQSIRHGGSVPAQISLDGLTPGRDYKLQMTFTESCCNRGFDVYVEGSLVVDNFSPQVTQGGTTSTPTNGAVVTATFTASDTVANIVLDGAGAPFPDKNPILSALTLEDLSPHFRGNVALGKPIVDGSSAYDGRPYNDNTQGFAAAHVTDGSDRDVHGQSYWLGTNGVVNQYLVLDLEGLYLVDQIDLRNTHNTGQHNDRGTADFQILGSDDLASIIGASPSAPVILTGTLSDVTGLDPIPADSFALADGLLTGHYRYLRFETLSSTYGNGNVGLNEIEVYGARVPEPATLLLAALGLSGLGLYRRRRKR